MALIDEPPSGWLFNVMAGVASGLWTIVMILVGLLWKNQNKKIEDMKIAYAAEKIAQASKLKELRDDVENKHTENREDILLLHSEIKETDRRAQDRHNDLMGYLRDRPNGPSLRDRY